VVVGCGESVSAPPGGGVVSAMVILLVWGVERRVTKTRCSAVENAREQPDRRPAIAMLLRRRVGQRTVLVIG